MERHILLLLIYTSFVTAQFNVIRREPKGDIFVWIGATFDCTTFTDGTATWYSAYGCECNSGLTFSTENHQCVSYVTEGYYRFGSNSETPVRCVYVTCNDNNLCTFMAPKTNTKLPVSAPTNPLSSSDKCVVNYVEMIHDCMPRRVDVTLKFTSYPADNRLYLQLERTTPLSYLEGELFKADVTCDNEYGNGKLFFKYNGTRNLLEKGSFKNIPPYDPSATSCSESILSTPTHTVSQTVMDTATQTPILVQTISSSGQPVSLTSERSGDTDEHTSGIAIGAGVVAIILIMLMVSVISCVILKRRHAYKKIVEVNAGPGIDDTTHSHYVFDREYEGRS